MRLIKYRDAGMNTYTYFWVRGEAGGVISPFFDSEKEAQDWAEDKVASLEEAEEFSKKRNYRWEGDCI
jgi:hypothetical protein